jgi:hypothetical protein
MALRRPLAENAGTDWHSPCKLLGLRARVAQSCATRWGSSAEKGHMNGREHTGDQGWKRSIATWMVVVAAIACGEAEQLPAVETPAPGGASAGAAGSEDAAASGDTGGGTTVPSEQGACPSVRFVGVQVLQTPPSAGSAMPFPRAFEGEVVAQGVGLPAEAPALPYDATSNDEVGWLRVAETMREDAGAPDGGASADSAARVSWTVVGPRGIGEIPAPAGERARVAVENVFRGAYAPSHYSVVMTLGERLALFHQNTYIEPLGERDGLTLTLGAVACEYVQSDGCIRNVHHDLGVTVPGGASGTLSPGERATVGDYDVFHGYTNTIVRLRPVISATGQCSDQFDGPSQVTAILRPSPGR